MRKLLSLTIRFYSYFISPFLGSNCRFYPTCSVYAQEAIEKYGVVKGLALTSRRVCACHPFHDGGFDPVP